MLRPDYRLEWSRLTPGYPVQIPVVDIVEIGAGGGSIARVGEDGTLRVGPRSAGADPGPACYGRGGTAATVTDAKLLTGVIDPRGFAEGRLPLEPVLAERAFAPLALALGVPVAVAARAVIRLAEANMINALKLVTVQRGHDPRDLTLVASGGGGPMHAARLARELGVRRLVIPRHAGLFSAWGMLAARPRIDLHRTRLLTLTADTFGRLGELFAELEAEAARNFGRSAATLLMTRSIEMRYAGQEHAVATRCDPEAGVAALAEAFHAAHEQAYTFRLEGTAVELVTFHLAAEMDAPRIDMPALPPGGTLAEACVGRRVLDEGDGEAAEAPVFARDRLPAGRSCPAPR